MRKWGGKPELCNQQAIHGPQFESDRYGPLSPRFIMALLLVQSHRSALTMVGLANGSTSCKLFRLPKQYFIDQIVASPSMLPLLVMCISPLCHLPIVLSSGFLGEHWQLSQFSCPFLYTDRWIFVFMVVHEGLKWVMHPHCWVLYKHCKDHPCPKQPTLSKTRHETCMRRTGWQRRGNGGGLN